MADAQPAQQPTLRDEILRAPDDVWKQIQEYTQAGSREEAAVMAESDPDVASTIREILGGASQSLLTRPRTAGRSLLTSPRPAEKPLAERVYPKAGRAAGLEF